MLGVVQASFLTNSKERGGFMVETCGTCKSCVSTVHRRACGPTSHTVGHCDRFQLCQLLLGVVQASFLTKSRERGGFMVETCGICKSCVSSVHRRACGPTFNTVDHCDRFQPRVHKQAEETVAFVGVVPSFRGRGGGYRFSPTWPKNKQIDY